MRKKMNLGFLKTIPASGKVLILASAIFTCSTAAHSQFTTQSVRVGGNGAMTSIQFHPKVQNLIYATTDVGTPYRWNPFKTDAAGNVGGWEGLFYKLPQKYLWRNRCGNIAFDPSDATGNMLYATFGRAWEYGGFLISKDRGNTWSDLGLEAAGFKIDVQPNTNQRHGQKVVVDPSNSRVIYITTRDTFPKNTVGKIDALRGTFKVTINSDITAASWSKVSDICGFFMLFHPNNNTLAYIGSRDGVYILNTTNNSTTLMNGSPAECFRAEIMTNGDILAVSNTGLYKYYSNTNTWTKKRTGNYMGVGINPAKQNIVLALEEINSQIKTYISYDSGETFSSAITPIADNTEMPFKNTTNGLTINGAKGIAWNPFNPKEVWCTDFYGANQCVDFLNDNYVNSGSATWKLRVVGHEETVSIGTLLCPPSGEFVLHSSVADAGGWDHKHIDLPPAYVMTSNNAFPWTFEKHNGNMTGVAVLEKDPSFIVRVGRAGWNGVAQCGYFISEGNYKKDHWTTPTFQRQNDTTNTVFSAAGGLIAVNGNNKNDATMVWMVQDGPVYYSNDKGATWNICPGAPSQTLEGGDNVFMQGAVSALVADKVNVNKFYIYSKGSFYVGTRSNGVVSFVKQNNIVLSRRWGSADYQAMETAPGVEGDIWCSSASRNDGTGKLYHISNSGANYTNIKNVQHCYLLSLGAKDPNDNAQSYPTLFIYGRITAETESGNFVYYSKDKGVNWVKMGALNAGDMPFNMAADRRTFGRVYFGTYGNGLFYMEPGTADQYAPNPPSSLAVSNITNNSFTVTWTGATDNGGGHIVGYNIYINGAEKKNVQSPYNVPGLEPNKTYSIVVTSRDNSNNNSIGSKAITATTAVGNNTDVNIALNKPAVASSCQSMTNYAPQFAVDGNMTTRWGSLYENNQWIYVDLESEYDISSVKLVWEAAYAKIFNIQTANTDPNNEASWSSVTPDFQGKVGEQNISLTNARGRYVRIYCKERATSWGNSLYELQVFGQRVPPLDKKIWLKGNNGKYVSTEYGFKNMMCDRDNVLTWEQLTVESVGNGKIALKGSNGKYVYVESGTKKLLCKADAISEASSFIWQYNTDGTVSLKGQDNLYVSSENGAEPMTCNRVNVVRWESFVWGYVNTAAAAPAQSPNIDVNTLSDTTHKELKIYINPASNILTIEHLKFDSEVRIYALDGRIRFADKGEGAIQLSLNGYEVGTYILQIKHGDNVVTQKIMKK